MKRAFAAMHRLQWRVRFTWHGCRRTGWNDLPIWWSWSDADYTEFSHLSTPYEAMREECAAVAADQ